MAGQKNTLMFDAIKYNGPAPRYMRKIKRLKASGPVDGRRALAAACSGPRVWLSQLY